MPGCDVSTSLVLADLEAEPGISQRMKRVR